MTHAQVTDALEYTIAAAVEGVLDDMSDEAIVLAAFEYAGIPFDPRRDTRIAKAIVDVFDRALDEIDEVETDEGERAMRGMIRAARSRWGLS